ncbi:MAG: thioredoxin [Phycisphaerales bacterium]
MAGGNVREFTDDSFEQDVLQSDQPVLVDFWAEWCMPCRMLAPTVEKIADAYEGKAVVGKLDTDSNKNVAVKYGISAIPTIIIFKDGEVHAKAVGLKNEGDLRQMMDDAIGG